MKKRLFFDFLLLCAIFFAPWWLTAIFVLVCAFLFSPFYEVVAFGVLADFLYGAETFVFFGALNTVCAVAIFLLANYARKAVR